MTTTETLVSKARAFAATKRGRDAILGAKIMSERALNYFVAGERSGHDGKLKPVTLRCDTLAKIEVAMAAAEGDTA